jgi:hypothetical protein
MRASEQNQVLNRCHSVSDWRALSCHRSLDEPIELVSRDAVTAQVVFSIRWTLLSWTSEWRIHGRNQSRD